MPRYTRRKPKNPRRERIVTDDLLKVEHSLTVGFPGRMFTKGSETMVQGIIDAYELNSVRVKMILSCINTEDAEEAMESFFNEYKPKAMTEGEIREHGGRSYRCILESPDSNGCDMCDVPYHHKDYQGKFCPCSVANRVLGECFRSDGDYYFEEVDNG